jgi:tetratricopeptide (TPR) repeat protein
MGFCKRASQPETGTPEAREAAANALLNEGVKLSLLGEAEKAVATYEQLVAQYQSSDEPALYQLSTVAMFNKAVALNALGRTEMALQVFDLLAPRLANATDPLQRELAASAMVKRGSALIALGAARWRWVRNFHFRAAHLAMILLVCAEALVGTSSRSRGWRTRFG